MIKNVLYPSHYPKQPPLRYCGAFQATAILDSFGIVKKPFSLFNNFIDTIGFCLPSHIKKVIRENDLIVQSFTRSPQRKSFIIKHLQQNHHIVLLIGRGYNEEGKKFSALQGIVLQHYISIRGYDNKHDGFWIYDSTKYMQDNAIIGNIFLTSDILYKSRLY